MSTAPAGIVEQAQRLARCARLLPAEDAATALEQAVTVLQAAQAEILVAAERSGALKDSGWASVRSFAATILRRGVNDSAECSQVAHHLAAFPSWPRRMRPDGSTRPTCARSSGTAGPAGWLRCRRTRTCWSTWPSAPDPARWPRAAVARRARHMQVGLGSGTRTRE